MQGLSSVIGQALGLIGAGDPWLMAVVGRSLRISVGATVCAAVVGLLLAGVVAGSSAPARRVVVPVVQTAAMLPAVLIGLLVAILLGRMGSDGTAGGVRTALAVGTGQAVMGLFVVAAAAERPLRTASERLRKTALTLGAGPAQAWWLMAGEARAELVAAVAAAFARVVGEAGSALLLGGASATMAAAIATQGQQQAWSRAVALGFVLSVLAIGTGVVAVRLRDDGG